MRSKPRGLVLIISNIEYKPEDKPRFSATHDTDNLQELFEEMGFKVIVHQNLTGSVCINSAKERENVTQYVKYIFNTIYIYWEIILNNFVYYDKIKLDFY